MGSLSYDFLNFSLGVYGIINFCLFDLFFFWCFCFVLFWGAGDLVFGSIFNLCGQNCACGPH